MNDSDQLSLNPLPAGGARQSRPAILTVVLLYAIFASLWIILSDKAVEWLFSTPSLIILAGTLKGWLFVAVTSLLLYGLMRRLLGRTGAVAAAWRPLALPVILIAVTIAALTAGGIFHTVIRQKDKEAVRLQAIADLKTRQIADWLKERQDDALFVLTSRFWTENYHRWRNGGDLRSRDRLLGRLEEFRKYNAFQVLLLLEEQGKPLWSSEKGSLVVDPALGAIAQRAAARGRVTRLGPYRDEAGRVHLDYVVPLPALNGRPGPIVVLRLDPKVYLFPVLQNWPVPSTSSETLLFRRDGDQILFLNELRHRADTALRLRLPAAENNLLAAQVLRGQIKLGRPAEGVDYRGVPILGVARTVPGTDWFLVAKLDRAEIYAEAINDVLWITLAGLLALFAAAAGAFLYRQRQELVFSQREQRVQAEKLRALQLLEAIAEGSTDSIFVKDAEGRYLLFNRGAARVSGRTPEEALGRDDRAIFPPGQAERVMANDRLVMGDDRVRTFQEDLTTFEGEGTFLSTKGPLHDTDGRVIGMFGISRDITKLRQAEGALQKSEEKYRLVAEYVSDIIWVLDLDGGRFRYVSPSGERVLGYTVEELLSRDPWATLTPEWLTKVETVLPERIEQFREGHIEFFADEIELLRKDGTTVSVEISTRFVRNQVSGHLEIIGVTRDITERKRTERERELTVDLLRLVSESRSREEMIQRAATFFQQQSGFEAVGIRLKDGDDYPYFEARGFPAEFVLAENSLCARSSTGEVLRDGTGNPVLDCMCGNVISRRYDPAKPFFTANGSFWSNCTTELLATTTEADRQARTRNLCNGEGYESVGLFALRVGEDRLGLLQLNDRRKGCFLPGDLALWERLAGYLAVALAKFQAEGRLRQSEELYRSLFENMLNGFAYCRMLFEQDQPQDFIYLAVNEAFTTLTGLRDVVGNKVTEVIPGIRESDPELFVIYGRVALSGRPERFEMYVEALRMWFSISIYCPKPEHFVAVFDVITERKQAELELRNSLAEKVALLQEVHHRVKNNLQIVTSLLNLQARRTPHREVVEALEEMDHRVRSMALLHEMLYRSEDLARINLTVYVEEICRHLLRAFSPAGSRIRIENRIPRWEVSLEQALPCGLIINELVSNALKHGFPEGRNGRIVLELQPTAGQHLVLRISDDGRGLPPGFDLQDTSTLGLQLVSTLAGQLGGRLLLEQPAQGGTVFTIDFPFNDDRLSEGVS